MFDNRAIQVYLVEGRYSESELRTYLPAKEASAATKGLIGNLNALNRISDPLRRNNMIRTIDFQASASDGQVCATAVSSGVASGTVINGSLGPKQGRNTLYFGESIWLDRTKSIRCTSGAMKVCHLVRFISMAIARVAVCRWMASIRALVFTELSR